MEYIELIQIWNSSYNKVTIVLGKNYEDTWVLGHTDKNSDSNLEDHIFRVLRTGTWVGIQKQRDYIYISSASRKMKTTTFVYIMSIFKK